MYIYWTEVVNPTLADQRMIHLHRRLRHLPRQLSYWRPGGRESWTDDLVFYHPPLRLTS